MPINQLPTPIELIADTTDAVDTPVPFFVQQRFTEATLVATGLDAAETVAIEVSVDGGESFKPLAQDGADLTLTATQSTYTIRSPLLIGVTKSATAGAAGVYIWVNQTPNTP